MRHELKTWPEFFQATLNLKKRFELRRNDRDFKVGDELLLKEFLPPGEELQGAGMSPTFKVGETGVYTGREVLARVDYIMDSQRVDEIMLNVGDERGPAAFVIMSVSLVP